MTCSESQSASYFADEKLRLCLPGEQGEQGETEATLHDERSQSKVPSVEPTRGDRHWRSLPPRQASVALQGDIQATKAMGAKPWRPVASSPSDVVLPHLVSIPLRGAKYLTNPTTLSTLAGPYTSHFSTFSTRPVCRNRKISTHPEHLSLPHPNHNKFTHHSL